MPARRLEAHWPGLSLYEQHAWMLLEADREMPINSDGKEMIVDRFRVEMLPRRLPFVLPTSAPLVGNG